MGFTERVFEGIQKGRASHFYLAGPPTFFSLRGESFLAIARDWEIVPRGRFFGVKMVVALIFWDGKFGEF